MESSSPNGHMLDYDVIIKEEVEEDDYSMNNFDPDNLPSSLKTTSFVHVNQEYIVAQDMEFESECPLEEENDDYNDEIVIKQEMTDDNNWNEEKEQQVKVNKPKVKKVKLNFNCPHCQKLCPLSSGLQRHLRVSHKIKAQVCYQCGEVARNKIDLRSHLRQVHQLRLQHFCVCGQAFDLKTGLERHVRLKRSKIKFKCPVCNHVFLSQKSLDIHMKTGDDETCGVCFEYLKLTVESNKRGSKRLRSKLYHCTICISSFYDNSSLKEHWLTHTTTKPPFPCPYKINCDKTFQTFTLWKEHTRSHREKEHPYECLICRGPKIYKNLQGFRMHMKSIHGWQSGDKKNACTVCTSCQRNLPTVASTPDGGEHYGVRDL